MICEARLNRVAGLPQWTVCNNSNQVRPYQYNRPIVVKLLSAGEKFQCKNGHVRDVKHHSDDKKGVEYEVEFVDFKPESVDRYARFFTHDMDMICVLTTIGINNVAALGWKRIESGGKRGHYHKPIAWRIER